MSEFPFFLAFFVDEIDEQASGDIIADALKLLGDHPGERKFPGTCPSLRSNLPFHLFFFFKAFKRFLKSFGSVADSAGASEQLLLDTVVDLLEKNFSVGDERLGVASSFFFPNLKSR